MSVIFDALRRRPRRPADRTDAARRSPSVRVPTGLGLGSGAPVVNARPARGRPTAILIGLIAAIVVFAAWMLFGRAPVSGRPSSAPSSAAAQAPRSPATTTHTPEPVTAASAPPAPVETARAQPPPPPATASSPSPTPSIDGTAAALVAPRAIAIARPALRDSEFDQAVRLHTSGDLEQASTHYLAAIAADGRLLEARNNLGLIYRTRGRTSDAIAQFRQALAVDPRYVVARNHLAVVLMDIGRFDEARTELTDGLAIDARDPDVRVNLALVETHDGHTERAMQLLLAVLGETPTHAAAHYNLALLYDQQGSAALAYQHYSAFMQHAGAEYAAVVPDVRRRVESLAPLAVLTK